MRQGLTRTPRILTGLFSLWLFVFLAPLAAAEEVSSNALKSIDFRTNKDKDAVIVVELASPAAIVDIKRVQEGLSIDLLNTSVKDEQLYLLDVKDFSTVVESVEVFRDTSTTRLVAHINEEYKHDYRLTGRFLEIKVAKIEPNEKAPDKSILEREGKLISINFQDIPVRNVLQLIADYNQFNLVVSDSVEGNLTLRLDGVPWQQVLDIILQVKGLDKRVDGNVILVAPTDELDLREKQQLEKQKLTEEMGELSSEIIKVNFAKASDIAEMINGEGNISMLSERGSMTIDERTNSLLIRELPENIEVIREIIESLDIPVKQVQIEARIVTINEGNMDELGIRWGFTSINGSNTVGGSIENNLATIGLYNGEGGDDGGDGDGVGSMTS